MKTNTDHTPFRTLPQISTLLLALLGAVSSAQAVTSANLLGDPGFDSHPLLGFNTVLGDFTGQQNNWGSENGTIVAGTSYDYVTAIGTSMLSMTATGGSATQTVQVINLSAYAAEINAGNATFDLQALFTQGTRRVASCPDCPTLVWMSGGGVKCCVIIRASESRSTGSGLPIL